MRKAPERARVTRAVEAMVATGLCFEKKRIEHGDDEHWGGSLAGMGGAGGLGPSNFGGWVYRMTPALDELGTFGTASSSTKDGTASGGSGGEKVRYAIRQVLAQEHGREVVRREKNARVRRAGLPFLDADARGEDHAVPLPAAAKVGTAAGAASANIKITGVKRDFFGRPVVGPSATGGGAIGGEGPRKEETGREGRVWVTYHDGFSNAVRKPITLKQLMEGL